MIQTLSCFHNTQYAIDAILNLFYFNIYYYTIFYKTLTFL